VAITIKPDSPNKITTTEDKKSVNITKDQKSIVVSNNTTSVVNVSAQGPQGQKGDTGATGAQGPQGIPGPSGSGASFTGGEIGSDTSVTGSFTVSSSNVDFSEATSITGSIFTGVFQGALSSSEQIASDISGSWRGALSGSLNIISGSSTSTGSFGKLVGDGFSVTNIQNSVNSQNIYVDHGDTSLITRLVNITSISDGNTGLKVPSNPLLYYNRTTNPITGQVQGSDYLYIGGGSNTAGGLFLNSTVTVSPFVYSDYGTLHIRAAGATGLLELSSSLDVRLGNNTQLTGSLEFTGNITGSSASTGSFGKLIGDGSDITNLPSAAITSYTNSGDNKIITSVDSVSVQGEDNLTFNGSVLNVTGDMTITGDVSGSSFTGSLLSTNGVLSSSAQIASDISGSFTAPSASISTRLTTAETELENTLISGSSQISDLGYVSSSTVDFIQLMTSASYAAITPVSGTLYIIQG